MSATSQPYRRNDAATAQAEACEAAAKTAAPRVAGHQGTLHQVAVHKIAVHKVAEAIQKIGAQRFAPSSFDSGEPLNPQHTRAIVRIQESLHSSPYREIRCMRVRWYDEAVVIEGVVSSFFMKQMAQEIAKQNAPELGVTNRILVRHPRPSAQHPK